MNGIEVNIYPENDYRNYLQHHGVLGQKKGVRRAPWYPIADWEAHLKRTGGNSKSVSSGRISTKQSGFYEDHGERAFWSNASRMRDVKDILDEKKKDFKSKEVFLNAVCRDCYTPSANPDYYNYMTDWSLNRRANEAAILGLKAIKNSKHYSANLDEEAYDYVDPKTHKKVHVSPEEIRQGNIEWFLFEDQTLGMAMVADMINRGYTSKQVKRLIDIVSDNEKLINDSYGEYDSKTGNFKGDGKINDLTRSVNFEISEGNWRGNLKQFADDCEQVKNEESGKIKTEQGNPYDGSARYLGQEDFYRMNKNHTSEFSDKAHGLVDKIESKVADAGIKAHEIIDNIRDKIDTARTRSKLSPESLGEYSDLSNELIKLRRSRDKITFNEAANAEFIVDEIKAIVADSKSNKKVNMPQSAKVLNEIAKDIERVYKKDFQSIKKLEDYQETKDYDPEVAEEMASKMFASEPPRRSPLSKLGLRWGIRNAEWLDRDISASDGKDFGFEIPKKGSNTVHVDIGDKSYDLTLGDFNKEISKRGLDKDLFFEESISAVRNNLSNTNSNSRINNKQGEMNYKHSAKEREIAAKVREQGYSSLSDSEKKIYNKAYK